jgi:peptidoglycan/xylan/chitin deacetylase (PgdA/CDA1 family)
LNLKVSYTKDLPEWNILLDQIGLSYSSIDWSKELLTEYAVIILNSVLNSEEENKIKEYVEEGGSLLVEADFAKRIFKINTKQVYIKYLFSNKKIFSRFLPLLDLYRNCTVSTNANTLKNQEGRFVVSEMKHGKGNVIIIPGNFISAVSEVKVLRKRIYSNGKTPSERISRVSKGSIYHFLKSALEHLFHLRNLPSVSLWNFPGKAKNIFLFRIDTDYGSQEQVELLYNTLREKEIKGTWFVETKSAESWIDKYSSFENQEIGLHCYRHRLFNTFAENFNNYKIGIEILKKVSIHPKGIAAPFGEWNNSFNKVAENFEFEYSSEFSYSYDGFPQFAENILQIPIHPISFGRLSREGYTDEEMYNYFINVINQKIALCEPVIIYTHPKEERLDILKRIFNYINQQELPKYTFKEYSDWWEKRNEVKFDSSFRNNELKIKTENKDDSFWLRVVYPTKETYLIPLTEDSSEKVKIELPEFQYDSEFNPEALRKYNLELLKDDILFELRKRKL